MYKQLIRLILSTGLSSNQEPVDDDFFNEPSTMRVRLTAANAKDESPVADGSATVAATTSTTTYQTIARGMPGAKVHYAAASA
jgi:hypothetical protein